MILQKAALCRVVSLCLFVLLGTTALAQLGEGHRQHENHNYDARVDLNGDFEATPTDEQRAALDYTKKQMPRLTARFNDSTGVTRILFNRGDYLTSTNRGVEALDLAIGFINSNATALGLKDTDLAEYRVVSSTFTEATGSSRVWLQQMIGDIPVYNGNIQVNINRDGRIISVNNDFMPDLIASRSAMQPSLSAQHAIMKAMADMGIDAVLKASAADPVGAAQEQTFNGDGISQNPIIASLAYLPVNRDEARLVWNFNIYSLDSQHWFDYNVDAVTGQIWTRFDWVVSESYEVYPRPVESPNHTTPLPPSDGRTTVARPNYSPSADPSPLGWHTDGSTNWTTTRGNNVNAYEDGNNPGFQPDCGPGLDCVFPIDLNADPDTYEAAAVTNLFYWNNLMHDITYVYGFDEANGNFQENNFGNGGAGGDSVNAEAQDGSGTNNANFATPSDGSNPRMQMYLWTTTTPRRDGDFDNGIIAHEYGHGISNRLVGGPNNVSCLNNSQQPGEGWSDFFSIAYTAKTGDTGPQIRGVGTYALGQPTNGAGIRTQPYSTDSGINNHTYESIQGMAVPHGVGEVFCQAIWEVFWALTDEHGFSDNIYDAFGGSGNQRAILYVVEGMKNTACSPTFVDCRDGIIQAATDNFGGEDVCVLWDTFAAFGLGTDAVSGGSNSTSPTNGFDTPLECQCSPAPIANAGPDQTICLGDGTTIGTAAQPNNTYSWSPGGQTTAQISVSPSVTTTYTVTATTSCGSLSDSVTIIVDDGTAAGLDEDFEGDTSGWSASGLWHLVDNTSCASPGYSSATRAFYYGQDSTCNYSTGSTTTGELTSPSIFGITSSSTLNFDYYRVVESYSGTYDTCTVSIVSGGSETAVWTRSSADTSTAAWQNSGNISLSAYAGQVIQVRFTFDSVDSVSNAFTGWLVDDVVVTGTSNCTGPTNTPPSVNISAPTSGSSVNLGDSVNFAGSATDTEDGDISASLSWTSSIDGNIGSGASFSTSSLSAGTHTITASATDSGGLSDSDNISLTVVSPNTAPTVTITAPGDGSSSTAGDSVSFAGSASDAEDGDISASLSWTSSIDGNIGSGASFSTSSLSVGNHTITASATDSGGLSDSDSIAITVNAPSNTAPTVTITAPADGTSVVDGTAINFAGTAIDVEDGNISASISWTSSLDGAIGSGGSTSATLSVGTHTITASATDSGGLSDSESITVTVTASSTWTVIDFNDWESGFNGWIDGGSDCRRSANDASFAHQGTFCVRLRDDNLTGTITSPNYDLSSASELRISFWYQAVSFENVEDFFVEVFDGSSWVIVANYVRTIDFNNNEFNNPSVVVDSGTLNFASNAQVRIRCDASGNGDRLYIDEVEVATR